MGFVCRRMLVDMRAGNLDFDLAASAASFTHRTRMYGHHALAFCVFLFLSVSPSLCLSFCPTWETYVALCVGCGFLKMSLGVCSRCGEWP